MCSKLMDSIISGLREPGELHLLQNVSVCVHVPSLLMSYSEGLETEGESNKLLMLWIFVNFLPSQSP